MTLEPNFKCKSYNLDYLSAVNDEWAVIQVIIQRSPFLSLYKLHKHFKLVLDFTDQCWVKKVPHYI